MFDVVGQPGAAGGHVLEVLPRGFGDPRRSADQEVVAWSRAGPKQRGARFADAHGRAGQVEVVGRARVPTDDPGPVVPGGLVGSLHHFFERGVREVLWVADHHEHAGRQAAHRGHVADVGDDQVVADVSVRHLPVLVHREPDASDEVAADHEVHAGQ
jgi:hypothetical protein